MRQNNTIGIIWPIIVVFCGLIVLSLAPRHLYASSEFSTFAKDYGMKIQLRGEKALRTAIFKANIDKIHKHNQKERATWLAGANQFTAMSKEEFQGTMFGSQSPSEFSSSFEYTFESNFQADPPATTIVQTGDYTEDANSSYSSVITTNTTVVRTVTLNNQTASSLIDWVAKNKVTPVGDQGICASYWAYSTVAGMESLYKIRNLTPFLFSEQQLISCDTSNSGCNGGMMNLAQVYIQNKGLVHKTAYIDRSSKSGVSGTCSIPAGNKKYKIIYPLFQLYPNGNCQRLKTLLAAAPVVVAVDAKNWKSYSSGVFSDCGSYLNHGVALVAASSTTWYVKNSWGTTWGEAGFMRLAGGDTCGICEYLSQGRLP